MDKIEKMKILFIRRLKLAMFEKNFNESQLARAADTTSTTISQYVLGKAVPRMDMLARLCEALNVSADWLMGRTDEMEGSNAEGGRCSSAV